MDSGNDFGPGPGATLTSSLVLFRPEGRMLFAAAGKGAETPLG